jgi:hypothetical protein
MTNYSWGSYVHNFKIFNNKRYDLRQNPPALVITHDGYEQLCPLIKGKLIMPPKK